MTNISSKYVPDAETVANLLIMKDVYFQRSKAASNRETQELYAYLGGLCFMALPEKDHPKFPAANAEMQLITADGKRDAIVEGLRFLSHARSKLDAQALKDAQLTIQGILTPSILANPHLVINNDIYNTIDPQLLYEVSLEYGLRLSFENALPSLPIKFREWAQEMREASLRSYLEKYQMLSSVVTEQSERFFYYGLQALCQRALGIEEKEKVVFIDTDGFELDISTPEKLTGALVAQLKTAKERFRGEVGEDAKEFIRSILIARNPTVSYAPVPFASYTDEFYSHVDPEILFEAAARYDQIYCLGAPDTGLPPRIMHAFGEWRDNLPANPKVTIGVKEFSELKLALAYQDNDEIRIAFYLFLVEAQRLHDRYTSGGQISDDELFQYWKVNSPHFIKEAIKNYAHFQDDERSILKEWMTRAIFDLSSPMKEAIKQGKERETRMNGERGGAIASSVTPHSDLFILAYLVGAESGLIDRIGQQLFPKAILKSYREWKDTPAAIAFKRACKEGRYNEAAYMMAASVNPATPLAPEVGTVALPNPTSMGSLGDTLSSYRQIIQQTADPTRRKLYQLLCNMLDVELMKEHIGEVDWDLKSNLSFIRYISSHGDKFSAADMVEVRRQLEIYFSPFKDSNADGNFKMLCKKLYKAVTPHELFRSVYIAGISDKFEESCHRKDVPTEIRTAYNQWKKLPKSQQFIAECAERNIELHRAQSHEKLESEAIPIDIDIGFDEIRGTPVEAQPLNANARFPEIWRARTEATNSHIRRFYDLLILSDWAEDLNREFGARKESKTAPVGPKMTFMIKDMEMTKDDCALYFLLGNPILLHILNTPKEDSVFSAEKIAHLKAFAEQALDPKSEIGASVLDCVEEKVGTDSLFRFIHFVGVQGRFSMAIQQGDISDSIAEAYKKWSESPDSASAPLIVVEEREAVPIAAIDPLLADPRLKYIDVHHPLVTSGNQTQGMGYSPVDEDRVLETGLNQGDDFQDRTRTLLKVLIGDAQSGVQKITVRWDRRNTNDDGIEGRPYNLIDIEMQDGSQSRVVVCDYNGHMTYVERNALEMTDQETLQISALRANRNVWTAVHVNDKQWCERIQEILYTPFNSLTPELKSRSYWHGLKGVLTETFAATVMATGNLPAATDDRIIEYGPLAGRTTYSRMYNAANRGAVLGLEKGTTYKKLFAELSSGQIPELAQFMNRPPLQAFDILAAWEDIKGELGQEITIDDFADCLKVDGRDSRGINLAFEFGAVQGFDKIITDSAHKPKSLKAFLRLAEHENLMALAA